MTTGKFTTLGEIIGEGADHIVHAHPKKRGTVIKVPKLARPLEEIRHDLALMRKHFGEFLPRTLLVPDEGTYRIHQDRVKNAEHLSKEALTREDIRSQFERLLAANEIAMGEDGVSYDFFGLEGGAKSLLSVFASHKRGLVDKLLVTPGLRAGLALKAAGYFNLMPRKAIEWWDDPALAPQMANVVVGHDEDGKASLHAVDIALLHLNSGVKAKAHHIWNKRLMSSFFDRTIK